MTDIEKLEKVNRMQKIGAVIWKPTLVPYVELKVEDKDGKVLKHINKLCESFNRNFFNFLTMSHGRIQGTDSTFGSGYLINKRINASISTTTNFARLYMISSVGDDTLGIILGTSTAVESFEHYIAQTKILHGNTTGKLAYQEQKAPSHTWTVGTFTWELDHIRVFNNNSGGLITVNEVCLYYYNGLDDNVVKRYMMLRDLLAVGVDVPDAAQLTVTYHLQMVFPE